MDISQDQDGPRCGVCGRALTPDAGVAPTYTLQPDPLRGGALRPVLNKPIRMDPETGAVCWCSQAEEPS